MQQQEIAVWLLVLLAFCYNGTAAIVMECRVVLQLNKHEGTPCSEDQGGFTGNRETGQISPLTVSNAVICVKEVKREEIFSNGRGGLILH